MFCPHCGTQLHDNAVLCVHCGCKTESAGIEQPTPSKDDSMSMVIKIFLIIGCVAQGWLLIPLAWCLPITIKIFNHLKEGKPIGTGLKICTLLFVSLISGICLLCSDD